MTAEPFTLGASLLSGQAGTGIEMPLIIVGLYFVHLLVSTSVIYFSIRVIGGGAGFIADFPKALFTVFFRDLIMVPLLFLVFFVPFFGIIIAMFVWLGLIKYVFAISWVQSLLAWIIGMILSAVIALFIILPVASLLVPGLL